MGKQRDAQRILDIIGKQITSMSGATIDQSYGVIDSSDYAYASAYIRGDYDNISEGFRIPAGWALASGDYVRVSDDERGHRWIEEVLATSDYSQMAFDFNRRKILLGDGTIAPQMGANGLYLGVNAGKAEWRVVDSIAPGSIGIDDFPVGIQPVGLGATLPTLPHASWPVGSLFSNTTDGKMYRNVANVWVATVPTTDLTGQVTGAQIASGAVGISAFATGIRPVGVGASLPTLPDANYPSGSAYVLTTDGKMYRNNAGTWTNAIPTVDLTGQVTTTQIADAALTTAKFASGIRPVAYGGTLPTLPDALYPSGATFMLTTDGKLYRNNAGTWTAAVPTTDLSGTIVNAQIASGAVDGPKLAAGAIDIAKFAAGIRPVAYSATLPTLPDANYPVGSSYFLTTDGKIYRNTAGAWVKTIDGGDIIAGSIVAGKIAAGAISASDIAAGAITAAAIAAGSVTADKLTIGFSNLAQDPSFEKYPNSTTLWAKQAGWTVVASNPRSGVNAATHAAGADSAIFMPDSVECVPGEKFYLSGWLKGVSSANGNARVEIIWSDASGGFIAVTGSSGAASTGSYVQVSVTATVPTGAFRAYARFACYSHSTGTWYADDMFFTKVTSGTTIEDGTISTNHIVAGSITTALMTSNSINGDRITAGTLDASKIVADSITAGQIAASAINTTELAANAVNASKIASHTITAGEIAALTITAAEIASNAITAGKILAGAVTAGKIDALAVTAGTIAVGAVSTTELAANAITADKIQADAITATHLAVGFNNLIEDPSFERYDNSTTTWLKGTGWTVGTTNPRSGIRAATYASAGAGSGMTSAMINDCVPGDKFYASGWFRGVGGADGTARADIYWLDSSGAFISASGGNAAASNNTYVKSEVTGTAPAGALFCYFRFSVYNRTAGTWYADDGYMTNVTSGVTIEDGTVTADKIHVAGLDATQITSGTIDANRLTTAWMTAGVLQSNIITSAMLQANSISADKLSIGTLSDNMVVNPGAEGNSAASWALIQGSGSMTITGSQRAAGDYAFQLPAPTVAWGTRAMPVVPGEKYTVRAWIKGSSATGTGLYIRLNEKTAYPSGDYVTNALQTSNTDMLSNAAVPSAWTRYEYTYTVPAGIYWVSLSFYNWTGGPTNVWFDDVDFRKQLRGVHIENGTIVTTHMTSGTIDADRLVAGSITTSLMTANAINGDRITANTLNASKIVAGSITTDRMTAGSIDADRLVAGSITTALMTANTINGDRITANTLNASKIVAGSITTDRMTAGTIDADRLTSLSITATQIASTTITAAKIASGTITATQISSGTITATEIASNAITTAKLAAGAITADKLNIGGISSFITNPYFDTIDGAGLPIGWAITTDRAGTSLQHVGEGATTGAPYRSSGLITAGTGGTVSGVYTLTAIPVRPSSNQTVSWWARQSSSTMHVRLDWYNRAELYLSSSSASSVTPNSSTFTRYSYTATAPSNAAMARIVFFCDTASTTTWVTDVRLSGDELLSASNGEVIIDGSGITVINGKISITDVGGSVVLTGAGFGPSWRRFIQAGYLYNSDWSAPWTDVGSAGFTPTNPPPNWAAGKASTGVNGKRIADSAFGSGYKLRFAITAVAASSNSIWQYVDLPTSYSQSYTLRPYVTVLKPTSNDANTTIQLLYQYRDSAQAQITTGTSTVTVTQLRTLCGSAASYDLSFDTTTSGTPFRITPRNATSLLVQLSIIGNASSVVQNIDVGEFRLAVGYNEIGLTDRFDPTSYNSSSIAQTSGTLRILANAADFNTPTATTPYIDLKYTGANIDIVTGTTGVGLISLAGNVSVSQTLGVTGATTLAALSAGATTLSSTLGVTGTSTLAAATLSGTLGVTGATTLTSAALSTTLSVAGASTLAAMSATAITIQGNPVRAVQAKTVTTASIAAGATANTTVTWNTAFVGTQYTVTVSPDTIGFESRVSTKSAGNVVISTKNNTGGASIVGLNVIAVYEI